MYIYVELFWLIVTSTKATACLNNIDKYLVIPKKKYSRSEKETMFIILRGRFQIKVFKMVTRSDLKNANQCQVLYWSNQTSFNVVSLQQSYEIKSPPWTIWWFRILGIFSVENIDRLGDLMFQTSDKSQLLRRVLWINAQLTIGLGSSI